MRIKRRKIISEINVVPYIDVMLVLLVIFMVTTPLITTGILNLPEVSKTAPKKENVVTIEIRGDESIKIKSPNDKLDKVVTPSTLLENIERIQSSLNSAVVISAEKTVPYNRVLKTIETLHSGGITRVGLLVKKKK
ncbi:MAG: protein TolR [Burkholderiaceae bacterium]|nr:MAG: protein TolR [Burkholderiaceae bacterium]